MSSHRATAAAVVVWVVAYACVGLAAAQPAYVQVPAGTLNSVLASDAERSTPTAVAAFAMRVSPVTQGEFLAFVQQHPQWRRDQIARTFADANYLQQWPGAAGLADAAAAAQPVTQVSWFAAQAFCEAENARLPTWLEWEYVAAADATRTDARGDSAWLARQCLCRARPARPGLGMGGRLQCASGECRQPFSRRCRQAEVLRRRRHQSARPPELRRADARGAAVFAQRFEQHQQPRLSLRASFCKGNTMNASTLRRCLLGLALTVPLAFAVSAQAAPAVPSDSIYQLPVKLTDQQGRSIALADGRGHPVLVSMFYTSCEFVCPMLVEALADTEAKLTPQERGRLTVLLVTFDPARDTVAVLKKTAEQRQLDPAHWTLARTDAASVRKLAAALGVQYRALPNGDYNHTTSLILLDAEGRIAGRSSQLGNAEPAFVQLVKAAAQAAPH